MYVIPWKIIVLIYGNSANLVGARSSYAFESSPSFLDMAFSLE
ncbi:putative p44 outer membrane protein, N-terminal [Anaplasma phagocytophilum str. ApNP]|uniref:Putative p44 outer membrane protein, N-terminal n=1 Tax=Anaplasma phagocytophilum str. ApNP TaxID=1359153 RepID=A0A0F3NH88_ANAPH|nr:putative p44 outer membrane protein, N-terminal [Anaplasma phagocytophilum str. ApNP]